MNYLLTVVLLLAILIFASGIYRIERERASYDANTEHPENLRFILKRVLRTVQTGGQWDRLESMRDEVRQALLDLAVGSVRSRAVATPRRAAKPSSTGVKVMLANILNGADYKIGDYINELEVEFRFETPKWMGIDEIRRIRPGVLSATSATTPSSTCTRTEIRRRW